MSSFCKTSPTGGFQDGGFRPSIIFTWGKPYPGLDCFELSFIVLQFSDLTLVSMGWVGLGEWGVGLVEDILFFQISPSQVKERLYTQIFSRRSSSMSLKFTHILTHSLTLSSLRLHTAPYGSLRLARTGGQNGGATFPCSCAVRTLGHSPLERPLLY